MKEAGREAGRRLASEALKGDPQAAAVAAWHSAPIGADNYRNEEFRTALTLALLEHAGQDLGTQLCGWLANINHNIDRHKSN